MDGQLSQASDIVCQCKLKKNNVVLRQINLINNIVTWVTQGRIKTREEVLLVGMKNAVTAWINMLDGNKFEKMVLKIKGV